jgi:excisionase family DNA binding protein
MTSTTLGERTSPFMTSSEVAAHLRCSLRTVHELTRQGAIPHRKMPGSRRCLFLREEIDRWVDGGELEVRGLPLGGRRVRVK